MEGKNQKLSKTKVELIPELSQALLSTLNSS
jgi:hypothetical protein